MPKFDLPNSCVIQIPCRFPVSEYSDRIINFPNSAVLKKVDKERENKREIVRLNFFAYLDATVRV